MRYLILVASILIQTCIGGMYAWSEFVDPLKGHGLTTAQTQLVFGCLIAVFTTSMVFAGRLLSSLGPALVAAIGGVLFGAGYLVAGYSQGDFALLLAGMGVLAGIGTGFCYVCPLAMCARWFPERKGLVTGVAVAGFGCGAVVLALLGELLLERGSDVFGVFRVVGLAYGGLILVAAIPLRFPGGAAWFPRPMGLQALCRDRFFRGLCVGMFSGTFSGLLVIGNLKPLVLSRGVDAASATMAVSAFAVGNAFGRVAWGWCADRLRAMSVRLSLLFLAISILLSALLMNSPVGAMGTAVLVGIGFGACFIVYAAQTSSHYGVEGLATVYPFVFLAYGFSGLLGPWVGGWVYDQTRSYSGGLVVGVVVVVIGMVLGGRLMREGVALDGPVAVGEKGPNAE